MPSSSTSRTLVVGWSYDIRGDPLGPGGHCVLKMIPLELGGFDWDWVFSGGRWKVSGNYLWCRGNSQLGHYVIRVLEVDSKETWEITSKASFICFLAI